MNFDLLCEWGLRGLEALAPDADAVVIVDVLSFSTAVDIAVARGARIVPAAEYAGSGAVQAGPRSTQAGYSLSPASLEAIPPGTELILPSPNGGELCARARYNVVLTACLRNCQAVAAHLRARGHHFAVIPAGEQWPDGSLRPCLEDLLGAGAVLCHLPGTRSPEAEMAVAAFERFRASLHDALSFSMSGRELIQRGYPRDIELAGQYATSSAVPLLADHRFLEATQLRLP